MRNFLVLSLGGPSEHIPKIYKVFLFFSVFFFLLNIKHREKTGQSLEKEELFVFMIRNSVVVLEILLLSLLNQLYI